MYERSPAVIELLKNKQVTINECAYSSITRMELLGFPEISAAEIKIISSLLSQISQLTIQRAIEIALNHQIELLTLDKKLVNKL